MTLIQKDSRSFENSGSLHLTFRMKRNLSTILAVDDNPANLGLLFEMLDTAGFEVLVAQNGENALKRAESTRPDLILLDVMMPGMDGFETCRQLKAQDTTRDIPVMFMTALAETGDKVKGFALGVVDYITKPIEPEEVLARVNTHLMIQRLQTDLKAKNAMLADREVHLTHLVEEKTKKIENITLTLVNVLEHATLLSDDETGQHIKRIGVYSAFLAEKYGCDREFVNRIKLYAPLHDVGKVGLPDALLKKAGKYTTEEFLQMQQHVILGARILESEEIDAMARNIALYHHERWNGTGYVHRMAGEKIPLEARIVALADVYDALISKRVYKEAFPEEKVDQILRAESGKHFDPKLVEVFFTYKQAILEMRKALL
jgi:putative two-component system response regulator